MVSVTNLSHTRSCLLSQPLSYWSKHTKNNLTFRMVLYLLKWNKQKLSAPWKSPFELYLYVFGKTGKDKRGSEKQRKIELPFYTKQKLTKYKNISLYGIRHLAVLHTCRTVALICCCFVLLIKLPTQLNWSGNRGFEFKICGFSINFLFFWFWNHLQQPCFFLNALHNAHNSAYTV